MSRAATSAHDALEDTSIKFQETTRDALQAVRQSGPIQRYLMPTVDYIRDKYRRSPTVVKIVLMTFAALSAIPLACFVGFMGVVTLGCLIVGGIAFTIVEGGFAMFASAFLLPALGLVLLITSALGLFGLVVFTGYRFVCYVVGIIWGQGPRREVQHTIEGESEKAGQTVENTARNEAMSMKSR